MSAGTGHQQQGRQQHGQQRGRPQAGTPPWWKQSVVYQVYPRSFADSDGDGIGDLPGLIARLDYLKTLGCDVVWVSPFYPSPQADNGYDISNYQSVDPLFGTLADLDRLVAELHRRDMKLVIDIVVNHTSEQHPWFVESRSSLDNPKRDWYWWRPPRAGMVLGAPGAEPNDWWGFFSEPAWEPDQATGQYYLHLFTRQQPDLNWENPAVRRAVHDLLRWWLDRGVDGFRFDVINVVSKHLEPDGSGYFLNGPRLHRYLQEMHRSVWAGREPALITVGETPSASVDEAVAFTDPANAEVDMVFQFEHMAVDHGPAGRFDVVPLDLVRLKQVLARWQEGLAERGWNSLYWGNHDQPRPVSRYGDDAAYRSASAKALATVLHLQRGTPYVYQGEELGMANFPFTSVEQIDDVESRHWSRLALAEGAAQDQVLAALNARSRDHARTPMQWDASPNAGFTTGVPWLPVNPDYLEVNAAAQIGDPDSVFAHYQRLIALRRELPVVVDGHFRLLWPEHPALFAFERRLEDDALLVLANLSGAPIEVSLPGEWLTAQVLLASGFPDGRVTDVESQHAAGMPLGQLPPWAAVVLRA